MPVWSGAMYGWAEVCSDLGLVDRAGELYELLAPFSGQVASGGSILYGSIDWALGRLATTLERYEQADEHFAAAAEIEERLGAPLFLARTHASWARRADRARPARGPRPRTARCSSRPSRLLGEPGRPASSRRSQSADPPSRRSAPDS